MVTWLQAHLRLYYRVLLVELRWQGMWKRSRVKPDVAVPAWVQTQLCLKKAPSVDGTSVLWGSWCNSGDRNTPSVGTRDPNHCSLVTVKYSSSRLQCGYSLRLNDWGDYQWVSNQKGREKSCCSVCGKCLGKDLDFFLQGHVCIRKISFQKNPKT